MSDLLCPKCGSDKLNANKKGFSGKNAVAGALITGGIGILAGTIGSNKIKITCLSCGKQFTPGEGAKSVAEVEKKKIEQHTSTKAGLIVLSVIIIIVLFAKAFSSCSDSNSEIKSYREKQDSIDLEEKFFPKQTEASSRKEKIALQFSSFDGSHTNLEQFIKDKMNDPDSYEHIQTIDIDKGTYLIVTTRFRGKNAFGAKIINVVKAKVDLDGNVLKIISWK